MLRWALLYATLRRAHWFILIVNCLEQFFALMSHRPYKSGINYHKINSFFTGNSGPIAAVFFLSLYMSSLDKPHMITF
jgi:hypothetical protein